MLRKGPAMKRNEEFGFNITAVKHPTTGYVPVVAFDLRDKCPRCGDLLDDEEDELKVGLCVLCEHNLLSILHRSSQESRFGIGFDTYQVTDWEEKFHNVVVAFLRGDEG